MTAITELTLLPPDRETARVLGVAYFFTGKPCRRGHTARRTTSRNSCMECIRIAAEKYKKTEKHEIKRNERIARLKAAGVWRDNVASRTLKHAYGITLEEYEVLFSKQNGVCAICSEAEKVVDQKTETIRRLAVDHCHQSKKIRGLLCQACNTAIGKLRDNPELMERAAMYVRNEGELN